MNTDDPKKNPIGRKQKGVDTSKRSVRYVLLEDGSMAVIDLDTILEPSEFQKRAWDISEGLQAAYSDAAELVELSKRAAEQAARPAATSSRVRKNHAITVSVLLEPVTKPLPSVQVQKGLNTFTPGVRRVELEDGSFVYVDKDTL
jgi:hypothetical protein